jgi:hypothetical protein
VGESGHSGSKDKLPNFKSGWDRGYNVALSAALIQEEFSRKEAQKVQKSAEPYLSFLCLFVA